MLGLFMTICVRRCLFESYPAFDMSLLKLGQIPVFSYQLSFCESKETTLYAIRAINETPGKRPNCTPPNDSAHFRERGE